MKKAGEFEEIGHCGGKIEFDVRTNDKGIREYQTTVSGNRPVPMALTAVYALEGFPVEMIQLGGIGQPWNPPPCDGCIPVFIGSDSEGKFGHHCPRCEGYWRSGPWPHVCSYCGVKGKGHLFLSKAQRSYVREYCKVLLNALHSEQDGKMVIDMDIVADAAGTDGEKPPFYVSEQSQQNKFTCVSCGEFNDILGRFGYCSRCGTRNDLATFEGQTIPDLHERLRNAHPPEDCVRDAVASFDSFVSQYAKQLAQNVPMTVGRKTRLLEHSFHDLEEVWEIFGNWFDIDVCKGMKEEECKFVRIRFLRRHVFEHNGGEVTQRYLDESGDTTVRLKEHIHETQADAHNLLGSLVKMARNIHNGFHELIPRLAQPIKAFEEQKAWRQKHGG
jgi:hypothetical protein